MIMPRQTPFPEEIDRALEFDPLDTVEKITGSLDTPEGRGLSFIAVATSAAEKRKLLSRNDDLYYGIKLKDAERVLESMGFQVVYKEEFECENVQEVLVASWQAQLGILFVYSSFAESGFNGGNFYAAWKPNDLMTYHSCTSSGQFYRPADMSWEDADEYIKKNPLWIGDWHFEAARHHIEKLLRRGEFVIQRPEKQRIWLVNYSTARILEYGQFDAVIDANLAKLPDEVRKALCV